jgi:dTMP kinase
MRGLFIVIEGLDGSGKSTQARLLARWMRRRGIDVILTREPGGTRVGRALRRMLLAGSPLDSLSELLLYLADRREHVRQVIERAVQAGRTVISERFCASTAAYQGYGRGLDLGLIARLNKQAVGRLRPDLTMVLDLPPDKAQARLTNKHRDRLESQGPEFHRRVAKGYRALARKSRDMCIVPASGSRQEVFARVKQMVEDLIERRGGVR